MQTIKLQKIKFCDKGCIEICNQIIHNGETTSIIKHILHNKTYWKTEIWNFTLFSFTMVPWQCGKLLVWDATCPDTYTPSYSAIAAAEAGVANQAEHKKGTLYRVLTQLNNLKICTFGYKNCNNMGYDVKLMVRSFILRING